jgi:hypothetical protein
MLSISWIFRCADNAVVHVAGAAGAERAVALARQDIDGMRLLLAHMDAHSAC